MHVVVVARGVERVGFERETMDLLCTENINEVGGDQLNNGSTSNTAAAQQAQMEVRLNTAVKDPTFLDDRCLENLLKSEERHVRQSCNYFATVQKDISPRMRQVVAEWIIDVSTPAVVVAKSLRGPFKSLRHR